MMKPPASLNVAPSRFVRTTIGPMTKVLNPLIRTVAGRRYMGMAALVYHTGRCSGREYVTPVGARRSGEVFLVPLTFGTGSDWSRNLRAAGGGRIRWKGNDYEVGDPEIFATEAIRPLVNATFPAPMRALLKMLGIKHFIRLRLES
jgi:deazaflavin-dependent oxidoreductase (nitroreductase family)